MAGTDRLIAVRDRIHREFLELPGLHLTRWQAARLWSLDPAECESVMKGLVAARVLRETRDGYVAGERCADWTALAAPGFTSAASAVSERAQR